MLNLGFSLSLGVFYLMGYTSQDWPVPVSEWLILLSVELYALTYYFDLGNAYFIEQIKEVFGRRKNDYTLLEDDEETYSLDLYASNQST